MKDKCDYNCETCESCVYDRGVTPSTKNFCNSCIYASRKQVKSNGEVYTTWLCDFHNPQKIIDIHVPSTTLVEPPSWCHLSDSTHMGSEDVIKREEKKMAVMDYWKKKDALMALPRMVKWEDVKVGDVYHIPSVLGGERKDIVISSCSSCYIDYHRILKGGKTSSITETLYKSTLDSQFLLPSRIRNVKVQV